MKKILTTLFAISSLFVFAQTQVGINYQSIIRNAGGTAMASTPVTVEFKLYSTATFTNVLLYHETHSTTTNQFGMANLVIGQGTVLGGVVTFSNVPWIGGIAYEVYVNSNLVGSRQPFVSVPYALAAAYAPAPSVTFSNNVLSVGGNTVSITSSTPYVGGTGITVSGNTITNSAPDQTVSITGTGATTVSGTYPNFTINTPAASTSVPPTIIGAGATTVTSSGNTYTVTSPVPVVYTAGSGIDITSGVISNTATGVTPTITGAGAATVTSSGNSFTVDAPASVTPTITGTGATNVSGTYPNLTINTPTVAGDQTVTINAAGAATVTGSYPNFTVNVPNGTTLPTGFNGQFLYNTGGTVWDTLPRNDLYFDGTNFGIGTTSPQANFHVNGAGKFNSSVTTPHVFTNTITINGGAAGQVLTSDASGNGSWQSPAAVSSTSLSAGNSNITLNQSGNSYTVSAPNYSLSSNSNTLTLSNGSSITTATVPTAGIPTITGTGVSSVTSSANSFTVNTPMSTYNNTTGVFTTGTQTISVVPTLSLTGNVLRSGPASNSVTIPTASVVSGNANITVTPSGNTFSVSGVSQVLSIASNSVISLTGGGGSVNLTPAILSYTSGTNVLKLTHGLSSNTFTLNSNNQTLSTSGNSLTISGVGGNTILLPTPASPWLQGTGLVHLNTITDKVGIGTTSPSANLHVINTASVNSAAIFDITHANNSNNTIEVYNSGRGTALFAQNTSSTNAAANISNTGTGMAMNISNTSNSDPTMYITNSGNAQVIAVSANLGSAINASNTGSVSPTINATNAQDGDVVFANAVRGRAFYGMNSSTTGLSTIELASNGNGNTIFAYKGASAPSGNVAQFSNNSTSNASDVVLIADNGQGNALYAAKISGTTGGNAAKFDNLSTGNGADALFVTNNGAGAAIHAVSGPTVSGSTNLGLVVENGHIGSMSSSNLSILPSCASCALPSATMDSHSTDVAGTLRAVFSSTPAVVVDLSVTFLKAYKKRPVVLINVESTPDPINSYPKFLVTPIGGAGNYTGFKVSVIPGSVNSAGTYGFNYMVIEGKN